MTLPRFSVAVVAALAVACGDGTGPNRACTGPALLYAYKGESQGTQIVAMNGDATERTVLVPQSAGQGVAAAAWSPDGCRIAFATNTQLMIARADGSNPVTVYSDSVLLDYPAWSPDGRELAFTRSFGPFSRAWRVRADGSGARPLTNDTLATGSPSWSSDGRLIAYARSSTRGSWKEWRVVVMNVDGTGAHEIAAELFDPTTAWIPGTHRLTYGTAMDPKNYSAGFAIRTVAADGTDDRLLVGGPSLPSPVADFAWTPAGDSVAFAMGLDRALYLVSADGRGLRQVSEKAEWVARPSWRR